MFSFLFGSLGAGLGKYWGRFAGIMGRNIGYSIGGYIDESLFYKTPKVTYGVHPKEPASQSNIYGRFIPIVYGKTKLYGNIIWASELHESSSIQVKKIRSGFIKKKYKHVNYSYSISLAIAICQGEISSIERIWLDDQIINDLHIKYRIYHGTEEQEPDPLIESIEGQGKVPAFRGLAYAVFENINLEQFKGHIPQFAFEVKCESSSYNIAELINAICIIPGSGEFVYDTKCQYKELFPSNLAIPINAHASPHNSNSTLSSNNLKKELPNIKWVSVVVCWFASSLDIANCEITPATEDKDNKLIEEVWSSGKYDRNTAPLCLQENNKPAYGGTMSDQGLIRYLKFLKQEGYKIMLYPLLLVNQVGQPWRGYITGHASNIESFFAKEKGYNNFILHYADLCKELIDGFIIGSELKGITSIKGENNIFPGVNELCKLAKLIKNILPDKIITYAADWSEYHHIDGVYHMDALWSTSDIDVVGIDAYFPLTSGKNSTYELETLQTGWQSGEGYDFYYEDHDKTIKKPLEPEFAWKNIHHWWATEHVNLDGSKTAWKPKMKKIWFTEYGFPSLACSSNEPNKFLDYNSIDNGLPIHSDGSTDFYAQHQAILATELFWQNSDMVEQKFLWCWDARPYPLWPTLEEVWSDGYKWEKGHWVQGKLGVSSLNSIVYDLSTKAGIEAKNIYCNISGDIEGWSHTEYSTAKSIILQLAEIYGFIIREKNGILEFISKSYKSHNINADDIIQNNNDLQIARNNDSGSSQIVLHYITNDSNYQPKNCFARADNSLINGKKSVYLPFAISDHYAKNLADDMLARINKSKNKLQLSLPSKYYYIDVGDRISIVLQSYKFDGIVQNIEINNIGVITIESIL